MKPTSGALFVLAIAATIAAGATGALAQTSSPQQGAIGLFGGSNSDATAREKLDLTLSSTEAYDSDVVEEAKAAVGLGGLESTGYSTMVVGAADYSRQGRFLQIRATGTSSMRYNRPLDGILYSSYRSVNHSAGLGVVVRLHKRTSVFVNQTASLSPSYLYNLFPRPSASIDGEAPPAAPDYALNGAESHSHGTAMTLTHALTQRSTVSATADYQNTDTLAGIAGRRTLDAYAIRTHFSRRFSQNTAAMADYLYRITDVRNTVGAAIGKASLAEHAINVGVDYNWRLSARRRLTFGVLVGSSTTIVPAPAILESAVPESAAPDSAGPDQALPESAVPESTAPESATAESAEGAGIGDRYLRRLSGQITIGYEFARAWKIGALYRRGVDNVAGLGEPISADRFTANIDGLLSRRVDFLASAGYSNGESALVRQSSTFDTYTGNVRLRYAVTRTFAASVEYLYYFYDSRGSNPLVPGIPSGIERKGLRAGLTLRVPALRR